jgi:hypothetical protein
MTDSLVILVALGGSIFEPPPEISTQVDAVKPPWTVTAAPADREWIPVLEADLRSGQQVIEKFFGRPFKKSFEAEVFSDRAKLDEYFKKRWQLPKTERWMVALGVADKLAILTPRVWTTQAIEHNPKDPIHLRELVAHELVHVYHGQHNPTGDFEGMDDLGWFVEGLAVYVSGQLDHDHKSAAQEAIAKGKVPSELAKAWSGPYRYGLAGSMVRFIDKRYGRQMLWRLLPETKPEKLLKQLNLSEKDFLLAWRTSVEKS